MPVTRTSCDHPIWHPCATMDSQPIVTATNLERIYGEGEAEVARSTASASPSSAGASARSWVRRAPGKSTLMHVLAGLDRPTSGSACSTAAELEGLDDGDLTRLRRDKLGFIFQFFNLLPVLTAEENITLPLSIAGRKPDQEWLRQLVDTVGLGDRLSHRPSELSGGQQQRVAVARALVSKPAVVFADEPTGNLDTKSSEEVLRLLRHSVDEFDQTVVMVTHDPEAASYADRLVVLRDGKIVHDAAAGTAEQVIELMKDVA